jgi:hypothetical protein
MQFERTDPLKLLFSKNLVISDICCGYVRSS